MSLFLLQIYPKLCYFIHEYACLRPESSAITKKLAKTQTTVGTPLHGRSALHGRFKWMEDPFRFTNYGQ